MGLSVRFQCGSSVGLHRGVSSGGLHWGSSVEAPLWGSSVGLHCGVAVWGSSVDSHVEFQCRASLGGNAELCGPPLWGSSAGLQCGALVRSLSRFLWKLYNAQCRPP